MGRIRTLARTFRDFATDQLKEPKYPPCRIARTGNSTPRNHPTAKGGNQQPLQNIEDYLNEILGIVNIFDLE